MAHGGRVDLEPYPTDHVYAVIDDAQQIHAAVDALFAARHDRDDVTVLCGAEGIALLDPTAATTVR